LKKSWSLPIPQPKIHLIHLKNTPIFEQLQLEEALLRTDDRSFLIINQGSPRAVVMGISGQPEALLHLDAIQRDQIPVIKRFSGGGTVIVDENTFFVTFILSKGHLDIHPFPEPILRWTADLYADAWKIPHFHLRENDYCIGDKKCGGNAQYIKKDRWLHHTSFLYDYSDANMAYLLLPAKRPNYRQDRDHTNFLTRLKDHSDHLNSLITKLRSTIVKQLYIEDFDLATWQAQPHRQATQKLS
jgi:lipoate-protein ligase A